ncbi:MAG: SAM-dependent methyltransferase [Myxococcales bacterium]|nr:SAM-dependent methyltransferase [Myxococcales bacterium]
MSTAPGPTSPVQAAPARTVHHADGLGWLRDNTLPADHAIVTSLPDASELPKLGFDGWRAWFTSAAELACRSVADGSVAIFFQTDIKHDGRWVDKAYMVARGAEAAGSSLLWHKIACRIAPGNTGFGRPAFAHLLCFSRDARLTAAQSSPDVLPGLGEMPWPRAMGTAACDAVCTFLIAHTSVRTVVDPFCGHGTMLAVANRRGLDAIGVELSAKRAEKARLLRVG